MQEIFLGARRPPRPGRLLRRIVTAAVVAVLLLVIGWIIFRRATSASAPSGSPAVTTLGTDGDRLTLGSSSLERVGDLWVLRLSGEPWALGYAEGRLLGRPVGDGSAVLDAAVVGEEAAGGVSGFLHEAGLRWRYRLVEGGVPLPRRQELAGLAAGLAAAEVPDAPSYQRLLWRETALDTGNAPGSLEPVGGVARGLAFVVGGAPPVGHTLVGRSFALPGATGDAPLVVSFVFPASGPDGERLAFARVGWAGEVGVVTGVNAEGVVVCVDPAVTEDVRPGAAAPPMPDLAREVLERAHDFDEAIAILQAAKPLGSASFLIVDGKAGAWAVVERTPAKVSVSRPKKATAIGDWLASAELAKDAANDRARRTRAGAARFDRLEELLGRGVAADPAAVAAVLRDRRGKSDAAVSAGNGNVLDDLSAAHTVLVDATTMTLWVGEGPGATGPLRAFDLRHDLLGEPARSFHHTTLAPEPGADLAATRSVVLALGATAAAAREARAGRWGRAAEHATRALALAPDLAEAHRVAGDVARERGEATVAADQYRRYLQLGPASPGAEADVKPYLGGP